VIYQIKPPAEYYGLLLLIDVDYLLQGHSDRDVQRLRLVENRPLGRVVILEQLVQQALLMLAGPSRTQLAEKYQDQTQQEF